MTVRTSAPNDPLVNNDEKKKRVVVFENSSEDMSDYRKQNSSPLETG
jgi:hypothetical protein